MSMDAIQDNLLTSSDYEQLIDDLGGVNNSFGLHVNEEYESVKKIDPSKMMQVKTNPPLLQDFTHVNNQGKHMDNGPQAHEDPSPITLENYMVQVMDPVLTTTSPEVSPHSLSPTCAIPCRDNYLGPFNFEILLDSTSSNKRSWVYSPLLNKVFIDMDKSVLVQFRIQGHVEGLSVRALPVYSMDDYISTPVQRCDLHVLNDDVLHRAHNKDPPMCFCANFRWVRHVVRSNHSQAIYEYDCESDRHSVRVPLDVPQAGADTAVVEYHFSCKTSCPRGMNRKPIDVVFTLETEQREVLGRYVLPVKICSCPKRDKEKEESDAQIRIRDPLKSCETGKRRMSAEKHEGSKIIKIEKNTPQKINITEETNGNNNELKLSEKILELGNKMAQLENRQAQIENVLSNKIEPMLEAIYQLVRQGRV